MNPLFHPTANVNHAKVGLLHAGGGGGARLGSQARGGRSDGPYADSLPLSDHFQGGGGGGGSGGGREAAKKGGGGEAS